MYLHFRFSENNNLNKSITTLYYTESQPQSFFHKEIK